MERNASETIKGPKKDDPRKCRWRTTNAVELSRRGVMKAKGKGEQAELRSAGGLASWRDSRILLASASAIPCGSHEERRKSHLTHYRCIKSGRPVRDGWWESAGSKSRVSYVRRKAAPRALGRAGGDGRVAPEAVGRVQ